MVKVTSPKKGFHGSPRSATGKVKGVRKINIQPKMRSNHFNLPAERNDCNEMPEV